MVFSLESRLNANQAHKATCRRSTSGEVVVFADALFTVFFLDVDMHHAFVYRNGVWPMRSVRFPRATA